MKAEVYKKAALNCQNDEELNALIAKLGGTENRFIRQAICNELTGEKIQIVKAGVSHLADYTRKWLQAVIKAANKKEKAEAQPKAERRPIEVGMRVVRKECKREGVVAQIEGDKLSITLADGDIRRPNINRFQKLYTW